MPRHLAIRRHNEIVRRVQIAGSVSVSELADAFRVSQETVRRDLRALADRGLLTVVHGGAVRGNVSPPLPDPALFDVREGHAAIARAAARLVEDRATVVLGCGNLTGAIADALVARSGLTICTNSLAHALVLCRVPGTRVFVLGGDVAVTGATMGADAMSMLAGIRADIVFFTVSGFAEDGGATEDTSDEAELRGRMVTTGRAYLVAEHAKFARRTPFRIPNFSKLAGIIVDRAPERALAAAWRAAGIKLIVAE